MGCTPFDYRTLRSEFSTYEMRKVWEEENLVQKWLTVEAVVAKVQGSMAIIPKEAADEIYDKASIQSIKLEKVGAKIKGSGHLIMGVIAALQEEVSERSAEYVHFGISSADILDTGFILAVLEAYHIIERDTRELIRILSGLAEAHKETVMVGRTHGQHANPITFGFKVAVWLSEMDRHLERLRGCRKRLLVGNISGAVGTQAAFWQRGKELQEKVLEELGLRPPSIVSHMLQRDRLAEFAQILAMLSTTLGKMGHEVFTLQRPEIAEVEEPFQVGAQVGSSAMPHKKNPFRSEASWGMARLVRALALSVTESQLMENENDISMLSSTYISVPLCCLLTSRLLHEFKFILGNLKVDSNRMRRNLDVTKGLSYSGPIMMKLAKIIGRKTAHELVYDLAMKAYQNEKDFEALLLESEEIRKYLTVEEIQKALDPLLNTGTASDQVEHVLRELESKRDDSNGEG
jgi:3-carboxy-cis,cis-muconate cycloisomerase